MQPSGRRAIAPLCEPCARPSCLPAVCSPLRSDDNCPRAVARAVVVLKCNAERLDTEEQHLRDLQDVKAREKFMRSLFSQIDADGNGTLDREEVELFSKQLETAQMSEEELTNAMLAMDADGDGAVTYEEFVTRWDAKHGTLGPQSISMGAPVPQGSLAAMQPVPRDLRPGTT